MSKFSYLVTFVVLIYVCSCTNIYTNAIFYNSSDTLPNQFVDFEQDFALNFFNNQKVIAEPTNNTLRKFMFPRALLFGKKPKAIVISATNSNKYDKSINGLLVAVEIIDKSQEDIIKSYYYNKGVFAYDTISYYRYDMEISKSKFRVIDYIKKTSKGNVIRIMFTTPILQNNLLQYPYIEEVAIAIIKTLQLNFVSIEYEAIKQNIFSYMYDKFDKNGNYVLGNYFLNIISDSIPNIVYYRALYNSFLGNYEYNINKLLKRNPPKVSITPKYVDIDTYFDSVAAKYDVLLFNEDHRDPYCRFVVRSLLPLLKLHGYTMFGIETLSYANMDKLQPKHGIGFFTDEPEMANLIRDAVKLGFKIFPYEAHSNECDTCKSIRSQMQFRETKQALNINQQLKDNHNAKCIILAGHAHINKTNPDKRFRYMAEELIRFSEKKILSVNQTDQNTYQIPKNLKHRDYISFDNALNPYLTSFKNNEVDIQILHHGEFHYNKKFNFNQNIGTDTLLNVELPKGKEGYLFIYYKNEFDKFGKNSVPCSVININKGRNIKLKLNQNASYIISGVDIYAKPFFLKKLDL